MAGSHSKLSVVKLDTSGGVLTDISTFCNMVKTPTEMGEDDVTTFGSTYEDYLPGYASGTVEMGGPWRRAVEQHMAPIFAAFQAESIQSVSFEYGPEGTDNGDIKRYGELCMLSYTGPEADAKSPQKWSAKFRIKSPGLTVTTY